MLASAVVFKNINNELLAADIRIVSLSAE